MKQQNKSLCITTLAPILLFAVFASCVVIVLLFGANIYQKLALRDRENYQQRTAVQYMTTRVRQSDAAGMVFLGNFHEAVPQDAGDTVFIEEVVGDRTYYTRIYCYDGYLCEMFSEETSEFHPEDGERILEADQLRIRQAGACFWFEMTLPDGEMVSFMVTCRSGEGAR